MIKYKLFTKKIILGKKRNIYKKKNQKKEYLKYKNKMINISKFKKKLLNKKKRGGYFDKIREYFSEKKNLREQQQIQRELRKEEQRVKIEENARAQEQEKMLEQLRQKHKYKLSQPQHQYQLHQQQQQQYQYQLPQQYRQLPPPMLLRQQPQQQYGQLVSSRQTHHRRSTAFPQPLSKPISSNKLSPINEMGTQSTINAAPFIKKPSSSSSSSSASSNAAQKTQEPPPEDTLADDDELVWPELRKLVKEEYLSRDIVGEHMGGEGKKPSKNMIKMEKEIGEFLNVYFVCNNKKKLAAIDFSSYGKNKLKKYNKSLINKIIDKCNKNNIKALHNTKKKGMYTKTIFYKKNNYKNALKLMELLWNPNLILWHPIDRSIAIELLLGNKEKDIKIFIEKIYNIQFDKNKLNIVYKIIKNKIKTMKISIEDLKIHSNIIILEKIPKL